MEEVVVTHDGKNYKTAKNISIVIDVDRDGVPEGTVEINMTEVRGLFEKIAARIVIWLVKKYLKVL